MKNRTRIHQLLITHLPGLPGHNGLGTYSRKHGHKAGDTLHVTVSRTEGSFLRKVTTKIYCHNHDNMACLEMFEAETFGLEVIKFSDAITVASQTVWMKVSVQLTY